MDSREQALTNSFNTITLFPNIINNYKKQRITGGSLHKLRYHGLKLLVYILELHTKFLEFIFIQDNDIILLIN